MTRTKKAVRRMPWDGYPITLVADRYTGTYSRGEWTAFGLLPDQVPWQAWADDVTAAGYWWAGEVEQGAGQTGDLYKNDDRHPRFVGRGKTPEEAIADLMKRRGPRSGNKAKRPKA